MEQKVLRAVMVCLLLMSMAILGRETAAYVETVNAVNALQGNNADTDGIPTVVIDAGHGGVTRGRWYQRSTGEGYQSPDHRETETVSGGRRNPGGADQRDGGWIV